MTGSQDLTAVQPPLASSHSPASTSSVSSNGSYGGYRTTYHPSYPGPGQNTETDNMGTFPPGLQDWEEAATYPHPANYTNYEVGPGYPGSNSGHEPSQSAGQPPGMTVTMCPSGGNTEARTGQHTVHFHVHQGEAVSLQLGEQVQMIQGPATVRMVSTSQEPPVPLPVQVPPGHFVHQIVDEAGVLQHVILSQHPSIYPNLPPAPNGTQNGWQPPTGSYHEPGAPGGPPPTIQCQGPPPTPYWNNNRMEGEPRPSKSNKNKNRGDHERRYKNGKPSGSSSPSLSVQSTPPQSPVKPRGHGGYNGRSSGGWKGSNVTVDDSDESGIGINNDEDQEEKQLLLEILSNIRSPTVPEIQARSALLVWSPPACEPGDTKFDSVKPIPESDLEYEVLMSDKGRDGKYRSIFSGASKDCYLTDLRPHTEYHIRVHAVLKSLNLKGGASDTVSFVTLACEPDQPAQPKLVTRSKTSIQLKWNSPNDNGAHIQHFLLESDEGNTCVGQFATIYEGRAKSFNVQKLQPSTPYKFRLIAVNELGKSRPSEITTFTTQGSAPSQPQPPCQADETTESSMRLYWNKRPCDDEFTLQMDDVNSGHGFLPQYNGTEVEHVVRNLKRNTSYRFKLRAHNEMGASQYSGIVNYTTRPARPQPPAKPQVKGKVRPYTFKIFWSCPADNGGTPITGYYLEVDDGSGWVLVHSGEELEFVCDKLSPGTQYRLRVAAESLGGCSEFSETCFVTTDPVAPGPPAPPQLRDKPKSNSLHLSWAAPENEGGASVTEFEIDMTSPDNTTRSVYRGRDTECVVASLMPGRPYLFQVRAQNRAGPGAWSEPLEVISGAGPPDRPKEPRAAAKSGSTASVAWEQPINNGAIISSYRLELAQVSLTPDILDSESEEEEEDEEDGVKEDVSALDGEDGDQSEDESVYDDESDVSGDEEISRSGPEEKTICDNQGPSESPPVCQTQQSLPAYKELVWQLAYSGPATQTELVSLVAATQYQLRLCAVNSAGVSPFSCNVSMVTPASAPACPRHLVLHTATAYTLCVKWKRPADHGEPVLRYWVEWSKSSGEQNTTSVSTERRRVGLTDLRPDTQHYVRVQAENAVGRGPFSPWLKVSTRPLPPAPPRLECQNVSHNQLKLRWGDAKTSLGTNYVVEMENTRRQWQQLYSGNNISYKVNKLVENTEYRVRICAISPAGQGPFSTVYTFKTSFAPPPSLKTAARVSGVTESECLVAWTSLKTSSPDMMQYRVQLTRVKDQQVTNYEAGTDLQLRIAGLEARSDYTVRVCGLRQVESGGQTSQLVGTFSPSAHLTTASRNNNTSVSPATSRAETVRNTGSVAPTWTDQQWAVIILCGFTLFSIIIAMVIQQVISWGTLSS